MSRYLRPLKAAVCPRYPVPADRILVDAVARSHCDDWTTLRGLAATVDPRLWITRATTGWCPSMFALSLALAAAATNGAAEINLWCLCSRIKMPKAQLPAALERAAKGPGHFRTEIVGNRIRLLGYDTQLLRPSLYARGLDIERIAAAPDSISIRGVLLAAEVMARASISTKSCTWKNADLVGMLNVRGADIRRPGTTLQPRWDWISAFFSTHHFKLDTDPFDERTGWSKGDLEITATPVDQDRIGFLGGRQKRRYAMHDGEFEGHSLSIGSTAAAKSWRSALARGLASTWSHCEGLWLAVCHAATVGVASPLEYFTVQNLRESLEKGGARQAFQDFCEALLAASGGSKANPRNIGQGMRSALWQALKMAQSARRVGDIAPESTVTRDMRLIELNGNPVAPSRGRVSDLSIGPCLADVIEELVPEETMRPAVMAAARIVVAAEAEADPAEWREVAGSRPSPSEEAAGAYQLAFKIVASMPENELFKAPPDLALVPGALSVPHLLASIFRSAWCQAAERVSFRHGMRLRTYETVQYA